MEVKKPTIMTKAFKDLGEALKYYIPKIEEFHVGFEFEIFNSADKYFAEGAAPDTWAKTSVTFGVLGNMTNLYILLLDEQIRVKYLDDQDIMALWWVKCIDLRYVNCDSWFQYSHNPNIHLIKTDDEVIIRYENTGLTRFHGTIRNKSELKTVMKMLGIEPNEKQIKVAL